MLEPNPDGPNEGITYADVLEDIINRYYANQGWGKDGHPRQETIEALGIEV